VYQACFPLHPYIEIHGQQNTKNLNSYILMTSKAPSVKEST